MIILFSLFLLLILVLIVFQGIFFLQNIYNYLFSKEEYNPSDYIDEIGKDEYKTF